MTIQVRIGRNGWEVAIIGATGNQLGVTSFACSDDAITWAEKHAEAITRLGHKISVVVTEPC